MSCCREHAGLAGGELDVLRRAAVRLEVAENVSRPLHSVGADGVLVGADQPGAAREANGGAKVAGEVLEGPALGELIAALIAEDEAERLAGLDEA